MEDRWIGRLLGGRFRVLRALGRGGMAPVYEAENLAIGRRVAIKILEPSARLIEPNARRFVREARALARVSHPNVVSVLDIEADRITSAMYIVMELLDGQDLRSLLRERSRLSIDEALAILLPIGDALAATHRASVVHCDVTPATIFLARAGAATVPKLIDFGLAQRIGRPARSRDGLLFGTPRFMAPEHTRGARLDPRADVWSFGAVLYRCVTGHAPSEPLDELPEDGLNDIVHRALQPRREARYASMRALLDDLRDPPLSAAS